MKKKYNQKLKSFLMAGFECADHINRSGMRINLQKTTQHDIRVFEDYQLLKELNISVVREGICWSEIEIRPYVFDFSRLIPFYEAAKLYDIQIIWDLCHFGYPDDLIPTHPQFSRRFETLAKEFCLFHSKHSSEPLWVIPINEISFLSWHSGEVRGTVPFGVNCGWDIKYHLCQAKIRAVKTIKDILPDSVVLAVEPLVKVHASEKDAQEKADEIHLLQYQAMDILMGYECPELGGHPDLFDFLGFNYYYNNQWNEKNEMIPWPDPLKDRIPFSDLLKEAYDRYKLPVILTETGHFGALRSLWIKEITQECFLAQQKGVDLRGICIYPVIDRPDWDDLSDYSNCGIWDLDSGMRRIVNQEYFQAILTVQKRFKKPFSKTKPLILKE